jgi:hypothetical protein
MHNISDIATIRCSSGGWEIAQETSSPTEGDGMDIEALIRNGEIWTGFPTDLPRNL